MSGRMTKLTLCASHGRLKMDSGTQLFRDNVAFSCMLDSRMDVEVCL